MTTPPERAPKRARAGRDRDRAKADPMAVLLAIDTLEVGPVRVEPRRMIAPYKVTVGDRTDTIDLIYRFEEDVFDPADPASVNLASMMGVQVAINYGLFCRRIVLHGPFTGRDRGFIRAAVDNTAREIFVIKFLMPNPFLQGEAARLPPVRRESYVQAEVEFPDPLPVGLMKSAARGKSPWGKDAGKVAVLSSGGKDSLLTFALLDEMGRDVHPIFVNESGRHWYTALNAYRYLKDTVPNTARVWTNADRVFPFFLRHFPFVRQDFANVRSDEYPIRLWTVAVFIFGALPLLRKRGITRLALGDEHDTTWRLRHKGITHYKGVYDQSRYFDETMSRYFITKGWGVAQFSVIRPLSEMLIEKVLVERYSDLQRLQVSCHATHIEGDRVYPCGACEKCRRIVAMLTALRADPSRCGYTHEQIIRCLKDLDTHDLHHERIQAEHLAYMLTVAGALPGGRIGSAHAHNRPLVLKLRFDPEKSPINAIPADLREPMLRIILEHATGSVRRVGRQWVDFDVLKDPDLKKPYPFEVPFRDKRAKKKPRRASPAYLLAELTWPEAQERLREVDLAILPVGSIEQHGPHLPLDTDAFDADHLARRVAAECSDPKPLVLPPLYYGVSYHHEDFAGTICITPDTLSRLVHEVGLSVAKQGISKLVIINGHGGNVPALKFAAQMINRDANIFTTVETGETSDADVAGVVDTPGDAHSGEIETSTTLATRPHLVRMDEAVRFVPDFSSRYLDFSSRRSVEWNTRTAKISPSGVLGDPMRASAEKGRRIWDIMVRNLVELIEHLKKMPLEEIYQRRY